MLLRACEGTGQRRRNGLQEGHVIIARRRRYSACQHAISSVGRRLGQLSFVQGTQQGGHSSLGLGWVKVD